MRAHTCRRLSSSALNTYFRPNTEGKKQFLLCDFCNIFSSIRFWFVCCFVLKCVGKTTYFAGILHSSAAFGIYSVTTKSVGIHCANAHIINTPNHTHTHTHAQARTHIHTHAVLTKFYVQKMLNFVLFVFPTTPQLTKSALYLLCFVSSALFCSSSIVT